MKFAKELQIMFVAGAVTALAAAPGYSQTTAPKPPAGTAPAGTAPAAQTPAAPPAAAQPAPAPQPPAPFPEGAKFAFVDIQAIASNSAEGKSATAKLDDLKKKKNAELTAKSTSLKSMQDKLAAGGSVMNDQARGAARKGHREDAARSAVRAAGRADRAHRHDQPAPGLTSRRS